MTTVYPGIPNPQPDVQSLTQTALALKSSIEILTGATNHAAVTYSNLNDVTYKIDSYITQQGALVETLSEIQITQSSTIASLQTTVSAQSASITTDETAITNIDGILSARYAVTLDVNHKITGFSLLADGSGASSFDIVADRFNIWASGYTNTPVFSISTINGVAALTINGQQIGDLSLLTNGIANNAVTNSAGSTGAGASGTVTITVRPGGRVLALAEYDGGDVSVALGGALTLGMGGVNTVVQIPSAVSGSFHVYYGAAAMRIQTFPSGGVVSAAAAVNIGSAATTVYMQELAK